MRIIFHCPVEKKTFGDLECGDIFRAVYESDALYMKVNEVGNNYNCVRIDTGEHGSLWSDDDVFPVEYELRVLN